MTIKVRMASRAPFTFESGAGVDLERDGNVVTAQLNYEDIAAGTVAGTWVLCAFDPAQEVYSTFTMSAALALSHTHTLSQISDMHADKRTFNAAGWPGGVGNFLNGAGAFTALTSSLLTDSTATGRSLLGAADAAAARTTLGFDEAVDDRVGALVVAGSGITVTYNDGANTLTIAASGTGGVAFAGLVNNAELSTSVGSSALTIALKTHAGTDPAGGDAVAITFQAGDGTAVTRTVTAATSIVVSSGSTLGTANSTAFRFWVVAFDDAGTVRLGVVNCRDSSNNIYPLGGYGIASSTAEGGAGAADSAHVIYTGTAVTTKPYVVIGYVEYTSGLGTAGTYSGAPNRVVLHQRGMKLPGDVVQVRIGTATTEVSHNSTSFTQTNLEASITLTSPANPVRYLATGPLYGLTASGAPSAVFAQMHRSGTAIGMSQSLYISTTAASNISSGAISGFDFPNSASALTYEVYTKTGGTGTTVEYPEQSGGGTVGVVLVEEIMA